MPRSTRRRPSRPQFPPAPQRTAASEAPDLVLYHVRLIERTDYAASRVDARRRCSREVHEFWDCHGNVYRKAFEAPVGRTITVPEQGTHATYNMLYSPWAK